MARPAGQFACRDDPFCALGSVQDWEKPNRILPPAERAADKDREVGLVSFRNTLLATGSLIAVCAGAMPAFAQEAAAPQAKALEEVVVTATRSASNVNRV